MGNVLVLVFLSLFLIPLGILGAIGAVAHFLGMFRIAGFFDVTINVVTFWNDYRYRILVVTVL